MDPRAAGDLALAPRPLEAAPAERAALARTALPRRSDRRAGGVPRRGAVSRAAVFFDRDGTLCREVGYVNHPDRLELMPQAAAVLREVRAAGLAAVVCTNQAGVARGYFPLHVVEETRERLFALLAREGAGLDGYYACVHHPELGPPGIRRRCRCRKPGPGMLEQAARELGIDLSRSFVVGDSFKDVGAGRAAGVAATVMLRTGYGRGEILWKGAASDVWPDWIADDLAGAWRYIQARLGAGR
ncbi:MAG: HAD-IIIA family hydrolase [Acidobacteria bacterium]|nr:MAG: HAD-IIIA family hydrolase [Acidobacteriota bacterium]